MFGSKRALGDSPEKRALAAKQRDQGLLHPGDPDYDRKLSEMWGGPPIKWFDEAMRTFPKRFPGEGRTALVTGSTGGIGFYIAKLLAGCGYTLIVPSRPGLLDEAQGTVEAITAAVPNAKIVVPDTPMDLCSFASVREFAAAVRSKHDRIDVLCLNAGRGGGIQDKREETVDRQEAIMQVNTTSQFLLACELWPLLNASAQARVVCQSSGARFNAEVDGVRDLDGVESFNAWNQYSMSKACMCLMARALNDRLTAKGVRNVIACVSEPGLTSTGVNIQHDLVKSLGLTQRGLKSTNEMHDQAGHHAGDGALPMALAALSGERNQFFCTEGNRARSLEQAAFQSKTGPEDAMQWPKSACDLFWERSTALTGATWPL